MAKKKATQAEPKPANTRSLPPRRQSPPAEEKYAAELAFLQQFDDAERPDGWLLSPQSVVTFVCGSGGDKLKLARGKKAADGSQGLVISEKFVGDRAIVERCVVTWSANADCCWSVNPARRNPCCQNCWVPRYPEPVH